MKKIGLIAGSGQFPIIFAKKARKKGYEVVAAAYVNEASKELDDAVDVIEWLYLGQVKKLIKFFKKNNVTEAVMLGAIQKTRVLTDVKPDIKAITLIAGMMHTHDDGILRKFAEVLEGEGVKIKSSTFLLPELLAEPGCWTRRKPSKSEAADIEIGYRAAKQIGKLDIGQCVVVGAGSVLAVEAIDGTDATILRGGMLGKGEAVVVKAIKPDQDSRFDVPATGAGTIEIMKEAGATALAIEANKTIVFDKKEMIDAANRYSISIVAFEKEENG